MPVTTVFIFCKPNRIGLSKTRLARDIGPVEAQRVNRFMTTRVMRVMDDIRWQTALCVAPDDAAEMPDAGWPMNAVCFPQGPGDLGDRLTRAFELAPLGNVIFIGTDQPDLSRLDISDAVSSLRHNEAVVGPASDGGFWLLGLRKRVGSKAPFGNIRWSSSETLNDLRKNLSERSVLYLEQRTDVDDGASLAAWKSSRPN